MNDKVNELKSALPHFMIATDRTLRSLDSPREGGISRIHFAAAERCLGAEWSAIEALMMAAECSRGAGLTSRLGGGGLP